MVVHQVLQEVLLIIVVALVLILIVATRVEVLVAMHHLATQILSMDIETQTEVGVQWIEQLQLNLQDRFRKKLIGESLFNN